MSSTCFKILIVTLLVTGLLGVLTTATQAAEERGVGSAAPAPPGFPVKVGVVLPLSGNVESFGVSTRDGLEIALNEARDAGWTIETVYVDSKCDSQQAVSVTEDLIVNQDIDYIIGAVCSSASVPMSELAETHQVVQIAPPSTNPQVTKYADGTNKEYVFRACFLDPFQGRVMASVARQDVGAAEAGVLYDRGNDYVSNLAGYFKDYFEGMGGSVPVYQSYTRETTDFSDLLIQAYNASADVLFLPDYWSTVNDIAEQADYMGLGFTYLGADGWDSSLLRKDLLEPGYFSTHFWREDSRQLVVDFVEAYRAAQGHLPDALAALGHDAGAILLRGIAEAGVDDPSRVKDAIADIEYEGVTGDIIFNEYGDPLKQAPVVKIEGGETRLERYVALHVSGLDAVNDSPTNRGEPTTFTATVETGGNAAYTWEFDDGSVLSGPVVSHTHETAGLHTAVVTASTEYNARTAETVASVQETLSVTRTESVKTSDEVLTMQASPEMTQTMWVTYTPQTAPTCSTGEFQIAGVSFRLEARDEEGQPVVSISHPVTMTARYDVDNLPVYLHEEDLTFRRYDGESEAWVKLEVRSRDLEQDRITVVLDHFSEFALLGPVKRLFLPLVLRRY